MSDFAATVEEFALIAEHVDNLEQQLKAVKEVHERIRQALLAQMNEIGLDSCKSRAGHTVTRVTNVTARVTDAGMFKQYIAESGETDLIQNRASSDACRQYLESHGVPPPGVEIGSVTTIRFTRSKA